MRKTIARIAFAGFIAALAVMASAGPTTREIDRARFRELTQRDESGHPSPDGLVKALAQRKALENSARAAEQDGALPKSAGISRTAWTSLGPTNVGGRTLGIAIHPTNPARIWVATSAGGVWTSNDRGGHWAAVNDFSPNLIANSILVDPHSANVMYVATGEFGYSNPRGCCQKHGFGIFKSTDGGGNFSQLPSTDPAANPDWSFVYALAMHPADSNLLFAATRGGIYRSTDAGSSWTHAYSTLTLNFAFDASNVASVIPFTYCMLR